MAPRSVRTTAALVDCKSHQDYSHDREIECAPVLMHEQRRQKDIVNDKQQQEDGKLPPYKKHLGPVEREGRVVDGTHIQTQ